MTALLEVAIMPKKPTSPPDPPEEVPSGTVRIAGDLLEMLRELQFHARDERGRRPTIGQLVERYLRPPVVRDCEKLRATTEERSLKRLPRWPEEIAADTMRTTTTRSGL